MVKRGKKKQKECLGRSLMKDLARSKKPKRGASLLHTADLQDGQDSALISLNSITDDTHIEDFLRTAQIADTDFTAQRLNVKIVCPNKMAGILSMDEVTKIKLAQAENKSTLKIPRRPKWDRSMDSDALRLLESESYLNWRRELAGLQEVRDITLTPFEKNIEFWRQLWRVIDRSDVVVQIVDARNPLMFFCEDLQVYVKEVSSHKMNLLLVNKAELLTEAQRAEWVIYFKKVGIEAVFFSALLTEDDQEKISEHSDEGDDIDQNEIPDSTKIDWDLKDLREEVTLPDVSKLSLKVEENAAVSADQSDGASAAVSCFTVSGDQPAEASASSNEASIMGDYVNSSRLLSCAELATVLEHFHTGRRLSSKFVTIGLVGYPNVGKSSTINTLIKETKVSVSATPGKTKHFQTIFLSDTLLLCDCPGLVFPAFVSTKEEMVISGILPIDQMRDHVGPMNQLLSLIPREILELTYGISVPPPLENEDQNRPPRCDEFLNSYGYNRSYMTQGGTVDNPRSARYVLKDYVTGTLLYCHCPPGINQESFHQVPVIKTRKFNQRPQQSIKYSTTSEDIDRAFFEDRSPGFYVKGKPKPTKSIRLDANGEVINKPCKNVPKRNTHQKLRSVYSYLDS